MNEPKRRAVKKNSGHSRGNGHGQWRLTREKILMFCGLLLIGSEFINAELRSGTFHVEFLLGGLALCGISIAQWGDRK